MGLAVPLPALICGVPKVVKGVWALFLFMPGLCTPLGISVLAGRHLSTVSGKGHGQLICQPCWSTPAHLTGRGCLWPPLPRPVSLGALSQSCLLPTSKTCSFPSENTNCFLPSQRTARVKWAMVREKCMHLAAQLVTRNSSLTHIPQPLRSLHWGFWPVQPAQRMGKTQK